MARDVLGGRVHDHVDAMVERLEVERRRPGVVDDARHAVPAAGAENARQAGIDDTGGAAALADNRVDTHA